MTERAWLDMAPDIAAFLADCPTFIIANEMKVVAQIYFTTSRAWRSVVPVTLATLIVGQASYTVTGAPAGQEIAGLPAVWIGADEVNEARPGDQHDYYPGETGSKLSVMALDGTTIQVIPAPAAAGGIVKAIVAYAPTATATGLPEQLYLLHLEALRGMVIARLKAQKGKPWHDPDGVAPARREAGIEGNRLSANIGRIRRNPIRTKKLVI